MRKKIITLAMAAIAAIGTSSAAMAAPIDTFFGGVSFSDTSPLLNNPVYFTGTFANPVISFAPTALGQTYTDKLTVVGTDSAIFNSTFNDNVSVSLGFLLPNITTSAIGGTGSLTNTFVFLGYIDNGSINWGGPTAISFTDGSILTATMDNISLSGFDGVATGQGNLTLKLTQGPTAVPEPVTLSLFGAGVLGAGALRRRRKQKKA